MADDSLMQFITQALYLIPMLLVGFLGVVLLFSLPLPTKVRALGASGLALILVTSLGNVAFYTWYTHAMAGGGGSQIASMMGLVRLITTVLHATGLALLVAAAVSERGVKTPF